MLTGVILAGGQNKRMDGQNKALLSFSNERLIERQIRIMQESCEEIIVVTNDPPYIAYLGEYRSNNNGFYSWVKVLSVECMRLLHFRKILIYG